MEYKVNKHRGYSQYPDLSKSNQFAPQVERRVRLPDRAKRGKYASESRCKMERFWQIVGPRMVQHRARRFKTTRVQD